MNKKLARILTIIGLLVVIIISIAFSIPLIKLIEKPDELRKLIESYGSFASIFFIVLSLTQVLIPFIPGEPFELLAGYVFGSVKGTILCLISGSIASIIIIVLVRKYGTKLVELFFNKNEYKKLEHLNKRNTFLLYSLIFILPGTPKDLLCYIAGLTKFEIIPLIIVTTVGRIPGIISSTIPANAIGEKNYLFGFIIYSVTIIISIISLSIYKKIIDKKNND